MSERGSMARVHMTESSSRRRARRRRAGAPPAHCAAARAGAAVAAFNASDGEWLCHIADIGRDRRCSLPSGRSGRAEPEPDLWLLFAPIKRAHLDWLIEKATELGSRRFVPVATSTHPERAAQSRPARAHAVAAAEQSERLSVPRAAEPRRWNAGSPAGRPNAGWSSATRPAPATRSPRPRRAAARADGALDRPRRRLCRDGA